jgi:hypothetical protein
LRTAFGATDETAEKVLSRPLASDFDPKVADADPGNWYEIDGGLRDEERIPLKTDIDAYFVKEVLPLRIPVKVNVDSSVSRTEFRVKVNSRRSGATLA